MRTHSSGEVCFVHVRWQQWGINVAIAYDPSDSAASVPAPEIVFSATYKAEDLVRAVARAYRGLLDTLGDDGYRERWSTAPAQYRFPHDELLWLEAQLA